LNGKRLGKRADPPRIGEHGRELLAALGCSPEEISKLLDKRIVAFPTHS
jgi:crotonobetainyl-CoA:carnitine CoA-transferase CaiB-like acyl-CoA transferase